MRRARSFAEAINSAQEARYPVRPVEADCGERVDSLAVLRAREGRNYLLNASAFLRIVGVYGPPQFVKMVFNE